MVNIDEAVVARYRVQGEDFEILVDCNKAIEFKQGKNVSLNDVLATNDIYKDVKKGLFASEHEIEKIFGTKDKFKVAEVIIKKGDVRKTAEYKNKEREERKKQIINLIHRNSVDPKTNIPHPVKRIELALEQVKIKVDEHKKAEDQVQDIVSKINAILPIKFETRMMEVVIPGKYGGQSYHILKKYSRIIKDEWGTDGSLRVLVEIPAGLQDEFLNELNHLTHGEIEGKIV